MNIQIHSDVFDINKRIKEIDESYYLVFNAKRQVFELHSSDQPFSSYCLTLPQENLDERVLILARKTLRQNQDKLIEEMEKQNQKIEKEKIEQIKRSLYGS